MTDPEAKALAARLLAAYPGHKPAIGTAALYVEYLRRYDVQPAMKAVASLIENQKFIPAVAELQDELREQQREWVNANRPERQALEADGRAKTREEHAQERETVKTLLSNYRKRSAEWSQPEAPVYVEVEEREGRVAPAVTCSGIGKPVVYRDGHKFCPDCENHDVDPGCISWKANA